jgi:hypothetical protein
MLAARDRQCLSRLRAKAGPNSGLTLPEAQREPDYHRSKFIEKMLARQQLELVQAEIAAPN